MNGSEQITPTSGPGTPASIPKPPHYQEATPGFKAPTSVPPPGQTTVTQGGQNAATGRFEIYRNGYRIATSKTSSHAAEIAAAAAGNWPNTYQSPIVTAFEPPLGY